MFNKKVYIRFEVKFTIHNLTNVPRERVVAFVKWKLVKQAKRNGTTRHLALIAHGTSWDESFVFPVDIQVEKSGVLAPLVIRLSVREEVKNSHRRLGFVQVNLSEFGGARLPKARRYLLEESPANETLCISCSMQPTSGHPAFVVPPPDEQGIEIAVPSELNFANLNHTTAFKAPAPAVPKSRLEGSVPTSVIADSTSIVITKNVKNKPSNGPICKALDASRVSAADVISDVLKGSSFSTAKAPPRVADSSPQISGLADLFSFESRPQKHRRTISLSDGKEKTKRSHKRCGSISSQPFS